MKILETKNVRFSDIQSPASKYKLYVKVIQKADSLLLIIITHEMKAQFLK